MHGLKLPDKMLFLLYFEPSALGLCLSKLRQSELKNAVFEACLYGADVDAGGVKAS